MTFHLWNITSIFLKSLWRVINGAMTKKNKRSDRLVSKWMILTSYIHRFWCQDLITIIDPFFFLELQILYIVTLVNYHGLVMAFFRARKNLYHTQNDFQVLSDSVEQGKFVQYTKFSDKWICAIYICIYYLDLNIPKCSNYSRLCY